MKTFIFLVIFMIFFPPNEAALKMCSRGSDCGDSECCVSNNPPRGRRFLDRIHVGHCVPMAKDGNSCLMRYVHLQTRPEEVVYACPCSTGLHCHGDGLYEVPLGERGHCTSA
ncbi:prokineticin Bm8-f-like [Ostrea edulis]|uniref:prokineticin Bm8-f-like n=1 Tax=Ostrea edulis TaxID=37623 RepID=UPI002095CE48|nr:prokineticin Bm8-f-like [Ostrea edulis]